MAWLLYSRFCGPKIFIDTTKISGCSVIRAVATVDILMALMGQGTFTL